jgi:hypothetical protein
MYPIPGVPVTPGLLAHTGATVLPLVLAAVVLSLTGFVLTRAFARRGR